MVRSESLEIFKLPKVLVVGVASMKSSVFTTAVTFYSSFVSAFLPLILSIGEIKMEQVDPTRTDSSLRWNLQSKL